MRTILVVEDEENLARGLRFNLEVEGYLVELAGDGETALELLTGPERERFDAVLLDVMLPGMDGFTVASELRGRDQFVPILMLTARGHPEDVLRGFEAGADDYLPKPFELAILIARLRGLLRRREWLHRDTARIEETNGSEREGKAEAKSVETTRDLSDKIFTFDGKTIDFGALEIRAGARTIRLTQMEAELLHYLIEHAGRIVSRKAMLEDVWNLREDTDTRAIDNFIVRLRKYLEDEPSKPKHLLTVRGIGYRFLKDELKDD